MVKSMTLTGIREYQLGDVVVSSKITTYVWNSKKNIDRVEQ